MATTTTAPIPSGIPNIYRPRGPDPLRTLFRLRFPDFPAAYEQRYAASFGRFRLPLISHAAAAFRLCGDWSQGIARIRCPKCGFDRFRAFSPFSCKGFFLYQSGSEKRSLLFAELSRFIFSLIAEFYSTTATKPAAVAYQPFGDLLQFLPHFHALILEGAFDSSGQFYYLPINDIGLLSECLSRRTIELLLERHGRGPPTEG